MQPGDVVVEFNGKPVKDSDSLVAMVVNTKPGHDGAGDDLPQQPAQDAERDDWRARSRRRAVARNARRGGGGRETPNSADPDRLRHDAGPDHARHRAPPRPAAEHRRRGGQRRGAQQSGGAGGIGPGDVILEVNRQKVANISQVTRELQKVQRRAAGVRAGLARRQQPLLHDDEALEGRPADVPATAVSAAGSAGLGIIAISEAGMLAQIEPFWSWHTPIAWTGFILFADAWIWQRRGESRSGTIAPRLRLHDARERAAVDRLRGVQQVLAVQLALRRPAADRCCVRYIGYAWAFATIWPAILIAAELVGAIRDRRAPAYRRLDPVALPLDARPGRASSRARRC